LNHVKQEINLLEFSDEEIKEAQQYSVIPPIIVPIEIDGHKASAFSGLRCRSKYSAKRSCQTCIIASSVDQETLGIAASYLKETSCCQSGTSRASVSRLSLQSARQSRRYSRVHLQLVAMFERQTKLKHTQ
jgi:hypothetical protein